MNKETASKLKTIIENASKQAKANDDVNIKPEHILLSILNDNDNKCTEIFTKMKIDAEKMQDSISTLLRESDLTPRLGDAKRKISFSDDTKKIIKKVDKESELLDDNVINENHIMLSILSSPIPMNTILEKNGITYNIYKEEIMKLNTEQPKNSSLGDIENEMNNKESFKNIKKAQNPKSKTPVLDNFCKDITKAAEKGEIDPVIGRDNEVKRISQILARKKKNNPVLIGDPGVGKTSIIEGLVHLIHSGEAPTPLIGKRIYSLDISRVVAGTKYRGQFEERMNAIIEECQLNKNIILFIDELHTIVGAGNSAGSLDVSNILKPALARGEVQIIGATTLDEYRENIEKDGALTRRFQQVLVVEPTIEETVEILMKIKGVYEKYHNVTYTDEAIKDCVKLADRFIAERSFPDKAIDVMDEAGASTNMGSEKPAIIAELELEHARIQEAKREVVSKQKYEEAAKLRDEERKVEDKKAKVIAEWKKTTSLNITEVGVDIISEVVSMMSGIPLSKISTQETKKLMDLDKNLSGKVIGQDMAVTKVVRAIKRNRIGIKDKNKPVGSYIFLGPTGVGKTLLGKLLAEQVYGDSEALIRVDMSEYMDGFSTTRLVGPPPGYVGYEKGGQLTEKVRRKPHCIVLFDEIEKAHPDVFNMFLQLLDDGHLTDGLGRKVSFKNALIIMTSNVGVVELNNAGNSLGFETVNSTIDDEYRKRAILDKALKKKFKPEFLNRIDETIIFNSLSQEDINKIVHLELRKLDKRMEEVKIKLDIKKEVVEFLGIEGYDKTYGARPLARTIQTYIEDGVTDEIISERVKEGETIEISLSVDSETNLKTLVFKTKKARKVK